MKMTLLEAPTELPQLPRAGFARLRAFAYRHPRGPKYWLAFAYTSAGHLAVVTPELQHLPLTEQVPALIERLGLLAGSEEGRGRPVPRIVVFAAPVSTCTGSWACPGDASMTPQCAFAFDYWIARSFVQIWGRRRSSCAGGTSTSGPARLWAAVLPRWSAGGRQERNRSPRAL